MSKISKIKLQKNKKRVNVYLDGKFAFGLVLDIFAKAGLKTGQELSEKEIENLIFKFINIPIGQSIFSIAKKI